MTSEIQKEVEKYKKRTFHLFFFQFLFFFFESPTRVFESVYIHVYTYVEEDKNTFPLRNYLAGLKKKNDGIYKQVNILM